jgi:hypothetical protein
MQPRTPSPSSSQEQPSPPISDHGHTAPPAPPSSGHCAATESPYAPSSTTAGRLVPPRPPLLPPWPYKRHRRLAPPLPASILCLGSAPPRSSHLVVEHWTATTIGAHRPAKPLCPAVFRHYGEDPLDALSLLEPMRRESAPEAVHWIKLRWAHRPCSAKVYCGLIRPAVYKPCTRSMEFLTEK